MLFCLRPWLCIVMGVCCMHACVVYIHVHVGGDGASNQHCIAWSECWVCQGVSTLVAQADNQEGTCTLILVTVAGTCICIFESDVWNFSCCLLALFICFFQNTSLTTFQNQACLTSFQTCPVLFSKSIWSLWCPLEQLHVRKKLA